MPDSPANPAPAAKVPGPSSSPSSSLMATLQSMLAKSPPFSLMAPEHVAQWVVASQETYFAPEEAVVQPADGAVQTLYWIKRGRVTCRRGMADLDPTGSGFEFEAGELFPVAALLAARPVTATYTAAEDCFCLGTPAAVVRELALQSPPLADFLNQRVQLLLRLSRRAMQASYSAQVLADQALERPIQTLFEGQPARVPLAVPLGTCLREALERMHERRVGSVLVVDDAVRPVGILTRYDLLGRVSLPQVPLTQSIDTVMSQPVLTIDQHATALEAALVMSRHGVRHVPIVDDAAGGRLVNIVSERDLFALQRLSLKSLGTSLRAAPDVATLKSLAADIRRYAANLLGQGVQASALTDLVSHLNDTLTARCVTLLAHQHGVDMAQACWLAFGSEGRGEQTVATDQDNGLVFVSEAPDADRPRWLAFAQDVNDALHECGYPRCLGHIMASNPACCLSTMEWATRFDRWIDQGAPEDLLAASIYFDLRPIAGHTPLATELRRHITAQAGRWPRFLKQMAENVLRDRVPLNWRGSIDSQAREGHDTLDLKRHGTAIVVGMARLYALTHGIEATGTAQRLRAAREHLNVATAESEAWVRAFDFLQMLRLQVQLPRVQGERVGDAAEPNRIWIDALNDIDRRMLKEALRVVDRLRQRVALDHGG